MSVHPLDDEEVVCTVTLLHTPTGAIAQRAETAPADGPPDVDGAVEKAKRGALDSLLSQLEQIGGA
jgi:hypothetical protein